MKKKAKLNMLINTVKKYLSKKNLIFGIILGLLIGVVFSYFSAITVENTADYKFCNKCHSMNNAVASYLESSHGGNNQFAIKVKCTDCHLPHDTMFNYLFSKAIKGAHDAWREIFKDKDKIDWANKLKSRDKYTYTSGCIRCHKIDDMRMSIPKAYQPHRDFIQGKVKSCIPCHKHVGHKNIIDYINKKSLQK